MLLDLLTKEFHKLVLEAVLAVEQRANGLHQDMAAIQFEEVGVRGPPHPNNALLGQRGKDRRGGRM